MTFNFLDRLSNTKIYDSRKKNNYEEYQHQDTSDISIPFDVIEKITKYINMNTENQIKYNKMMIYIESLNNYKIPYKIYKEDIVTIRFITIKTDTIVKFNFV
jgi:hypothetical protein